MKVDNTELFMWLTLLGLLFGICALVVLAASQGG